MLQVKETKKGLYIQEIDKHGIPESRLSVFLPKVGIQSNQGFLDVNNNPNVFDILKENNISYEVLDYQRSGFVLYPFIQLKTN